MEIFLFLVCIVFVVIAFFFGRSVGEKSIERKKDKLSNDAIIGWIENLVRNPDPLGELTKYIALVNSGDVTADRGPEVVQIFLRELGSRCKILEFETAGKVIEFNPKSHRSLDNLHPGEHVFVVQSGWVYNQQIIKYPIVEKVRE
jgi:hypothetical protein